METIKFVLNLQKIIALLFNNNYISDFSACGTHLLDLIVHFCLFRLDRSSVTVQRFEILFLKLFKLLNWHFSVKFLA